MAIGEERSGRSSRGRNNGRRQLIQGVGDNGDEVDAFSEEELARRPEVRIINKYAVVLAYVRIGLRGVGALALLWATVVLLGGFVSTLTKKDFWSLTVIAFVQAAGLSDAVGDDRFAFFGEWFDSLRRNIIGNILSLQEKHHHEHTRLSLGQFLKKQIQMIISKMLDKTLILIFSPVVYFVIVGPIICVVLSAIRVAAQDYGVADGDTSKANLKPALNLFYYVSLAQGAIYILFMMAEVVGDHCSVENVCKHGFSPEILNEYLNETKEMCVNNPASTKNWNLITYGAGLLDSQLPEDYASGGRVLTMLIDQDTPITQLLIRSPRQRIQKLIGTLGWTNPAEREMRWLAARIMEHIAGHLNLAQFPGALECISSLLDTSCHNSADQEARHLPFEIGRSKARRRNFLLIGFNMPVGQHITPLVLGLGGLYIHEWIRKKYGTPNNGGKLEQASKQTDNVDEGLVLSGLRILHNLAHIEHNGTLIYNTKVLLSKLVAPVSSDTLIEDIESNTAWTRVVDGSLKVVSRLMCSPGNTGEEMRSQISDDSSSSVRNLVAVLGMDMKSDNTCLMELQIQAIEALTQLALHQAANSATEYLIKRALHIFLTNDWMEDYLKDVKMKIDDETKSQNKMQSIPLMVRCMDNLAKRCCGELAKEEKEARAAEAHKKKMMKQAEETASRLKGKAGEALAMLLSMEIQSNSEAHRSFILGREGVIHSLTELLDSNIKSIRCVESTTKTSEIEIRIGCRISAAVILKHLSDYLEEPTLRKVLVELLTIQAHPSDTSRLNWQERSSFRFCIPANKSDEENPSDGGQHEPPTLKSDMQKSEERRLQAELLSLVAAVRASKKLDFASLLLQPQVFSLEDIVVRLKKMVYDNSYATPACLAILKLACQMVIDFIPHDGSVQVIEKHDIIGTLLKASKTMAALESSLLFAGIDRDCYGVPVKPLSSVLVKRAKDLLTQRQQELGIIAPAGGS